MDLLLDKADKYVRVEREQQEDAATLAEIVTEFDVQSRSAVMESEEDGAGAPFEAQDGDKSSKCGNGLRSNVITNYVI